MPYDPVILIWLVFAALAGMLIGSFLNVCIYRLPRKETIVKGHSYCPACKHQLSAADLIPVFSYLLLGRRCRYCQTVISARYAAVEIITGLYSLLAVYFFQPARLDIAQIKKMPAFLPIFSAEIYSLILIVSSLTLFYSLLVWDLILVDKNPPPLTLFIFTYAAVAIKFILQPPQIPEYLLSALILLVFILLASKLTLFAAVKYQLKSPETAGFIALALFFGWLALIIILLIFLMLSARLIIIRSNKRKKAQINPFLPFIALILISAVDFIGRMF